MVTIMLRIKPMDHKTAKHINSRHQEFFIRLGICNKAIKTNPINTRAIIRLTLLLGQPSQFGHNQRNERNADLKRNCIDQVDFIGKNHNFNGI